MKRKLLIGIIAIVGICQISIAEPTNSKYARIDNSLLLFNSVMKELDVYYVDTLPYEILTQTAINSMLRKLDPYTVFYSKEQQQEVRLLTTGKYGGIGSMIMQRTFEEDGKSVRYVVISEPYENMPAQQADLRAGDKILSIDGESVIGKTTSDVSKMLRGIPGTSLTITIKREGEENLLTKQLVRKEIKQPPVDLYKVIDNGTERVGYISFSDFTEHSADDFRSALSEMVHTAGITKLIIDIRGNGGGLIDEAVKIVGLFVKKNTEVVTTKGRDVTRNRSYKTSSAPLFKDMKLTVLVNSQSASASEILAGSLQDLDRATIVGTRTFGKGLVQNIRTLPNGASIKITTAKYYIPSGRCIQAIDYSQRRSDGSVERVPDSLTHEFKTSKGRIVRDGGGIEPDINTEDTTQKVNITYDMYSKHLFFDYATLYRQQHPTLELPSEFVVTDEIIADFENYLQEHNYTYETESSKYLKDLFRLAEQEYLDSVAIQHIKELEKLLKPSVHESLMKHKEEVQQYLGSEIVTRYYYQKGQIEYNLRFDKDVKEALKVLDQ